MKAVLTRRRRSDPAETTAEIDELPVDPDVRVQARWTGGSRLATRAATALLWAALLAGPAGMALTVLQAGSGSEPVPAAPAVADRSGEQAAVSEFAQRFVVTWLQASRGQEQQLEPYVQADRLALPEVGWTASQPATAGLRPLAGGAWSVVVGVTVTAARGAGTTAPARRYFQVPVRYQSGALIAAALPSPVAAPGAGQPAQLDYRYRAVAGDPVQTAVQEFLAALLAGGGDVTRYVSPGTQLAAVTPAPYTAVEVTDVLIDRDLPAGTPRQGERVRALITAVATANTKQQITVQYALTLAARAGRWEVEALDPAPATAGDPTGGPAASPPPPGTSQPSAPPAPPSP